MPIESSNPSDNISVTVNGESIPVPENGNINQTITSDGGTTRIEANSITSSETDNDSHTSTSINIHTESSGTEGRKEKSSIKIRTND